MALMTSNLLFLFWSAFVIGLSGAMAPGPVLTATISEVLKRGFRAGPLIVLGHALLELALLGAVIAGLSVWITRPAVLGALGVGGGLLLAVLGVHMMATSKKMAWAALNTRAEARAAIRGPVLTGILTSLSTPLWALWWATIGLNYAALALKQGLPGLTAFYSGHILADLAWYSLVALAVASGRRICPPHVYRILFLLCGLALTGLGGYFLGTGWGGLR
ncbi:MAG: LysE family transporter [Kiritimatiellaeota bacterium]|nr:LysE family transporter [Kiritimatiellota bacterium]